MPLDFAYVNTEQIVPIRFLKRIGRTGFAYSLFYDWRFNEDGSTKSDFVLNKRKYADTTILLARDNFGYGLSGEHAVWGLQEYGFKVIIAASFADIFYSNCFKVGLLPVVLHREDVGELFAMAKGSTLLRLTVDLQKCLLHTDDGSWERTFKIAAFRRESLLKGADSVATTLDKVDAIAAYEARIPQYKLVGKMLSSRTS